MCAKYGRLHATVTKIVVNQNNGAGASASTKILKAFPEYSGGIIPYSIRNTYHAMILKPIRKCCIQVK
ncbi:hypothetical protein HanXRQr2_Chr04g0139861 [Helianthus annuus]|uniref:Uncharacterized protein n=1 Tax=Helianthus annuus TaxID=4232 RepID=A0A9K3NP68_HELAN|nr:hypothetical protein HanXRQr2_Chr04g0139861 [Helianthus annuus]